MCNICRRSLIAGKRRLYEMHLWRVNSTGNAANLLFCQTRHNRICIGSPCDQRLNEILLTRILRGNCVRIPVKNGYGYFKEANFHTHRGKEHRIIVDAQIERRTRWTNALKKTDAKKGLTMTIWGNIEKREMEMHLHDWIRYNLWHCRNLASKRLNKFTDRN